MNSNILHPEDYLEPACVLCGEPYGAEPKPKTIPQQRVIEKMDDYMSRRDYDGAERHLLYWLEEAILGRDERGELLVRNELIGHFRKTGKREKAFEQIGAALGLLSDLDYEQSISAGTTWTNAATACNAFGENERALDLFEKARAVYEEHGSTKPELLGGLYNNMALTCTSLGRFGEAAELYEKALAVMADVPGGQLEQAITCLNMADLAVAECGPEESENRVCELLDRAESLLLPAEESSPDRCTADAGSAMNPYAADGVDSGYYAFVCEKCASIFEHYGYFLAVEELKTRSEAIIRKNRER